MSGFLNWLMQGNNLAYASSLLIVIGLALYAIGQIIYKKHLTTKGIFFVSNQFSTRNIAYMGIMIACSVSVTVVVSLTLPITVFPPIRVAFEGIMIKITGMIFGPVIGLIVGLITELLTMLFIPSFVHPAYFVVAIGFGFWAGICSFGFKLKVQKQWITMLVITGFIVLATWFLSTTLQFLPADISEPTKVKIFGILINKKIMPVIFIILMSSILFAVYLVTIILIILKKQKYLNVILPIFLICIVTEILVSVITASWGDSQLLTSGSSDGYISMVALRAAQIPVKIIFNTTLLSTVYVVLRPLIKNTK